jgi:hypothetical protein
MMWALESTCSDLLPVTEHAKDSMHMARARAIRDVVLSQMLHLTSAAPCDGCPDPKLRHEEGKDIDASLGFIDQDSGWGSSSVRTHDEGRVFDRCGGWFLAPAHLCAPRAI